MHSIASLKHLIRGVFPLLPLCPAVNTRLWCFFFSCFFCDLHKHKKRFILSLLQNIWVSSLAAKHWICWACYLGCLRNVASQVFLILCVTCLKLFSSGLLFATYRNIVSVCMVIQGIRHQWTHVLDLFLKQPFCELDSWSFKDWIYCWEMKLSVSILSVLSLYIISYIKMLLML